MNIFENLENLNVSEECFNDIMGIVEEILSEDELHDTKAIRRNAQRNSKILNKEIKANSKELGKAQYDNMIAGGDAQSLVATARWSRKAKGNQDEGTKNLCSNANQAVKKAIKTGQKVQKLNNKDTDLAFKKMNQDYRARKAQEKVNQIVAN
jgi:hypothetical protein